MCIMIEQCSPSEPHMLSLHCLYLAEKGLASLLLLLQPAGLYPAIAVADLSIFQPADMHHAITIKPGSTPTASPAALSLALAQQDYVPAQPYQ